MGGLGLDATGKLEVQANATVTVGGAAGGNVIVGDDGVISLGADKDLKIYHDGSHSYVRDSGTGNLRLTTASSIVLAKHNNENMLKADSDGAVTLYYDSDAHLATKQTGVGITGNAEISANVGIAGNVYIAKYMAIANTNPAATDALVVNGNIRIQSGQLIFADGSGQSAGSAVTTFPAGDYGLLDAANAATDSFGQVTAGLTLFDMLTSPTGSIGTEDLGALS